MYFFFDKLRSLKAYFETLRDSSGAYLKDADGNYILTTEV